MPKKLVPVLAVLAVLAGVGLGLYLEGNKEIKGFPGLGGDFTLNSKAGEVSLSDFKDKVVVVYFGYTNCPDACPIGLGKISAALQKMEAEQRNQVEVLLISIDPERDTLQMLENYTSFFGENFTGLSGTSEQIAQIADNYKVLYQRVDMPDSGLEYTVDHSSNTYVVGRNGVVRFIVSHSSGWQEYKDRMIDAINGV